MKTALSCTILAALAAGGAYLAPLPSLGQAAPAAPMSINPFQAPAQVASPAPLPARASKVTTLRAQPAMSAAGMLYNSALDDFKAGRIGDAAAKMRQYVAKYPKDPSARGLLGYLELRQSTGSPVLLATASRDLAAAVAVDPKNLVNRGNYASALLQQKRWADAAAQLHVVAQAQPGDVGTQLRLAGALGEMGRTAEANAIYARVVQSPNCPPFALIQYGITVAGQQKPAAAAKLFDRAAKLEPTDAAAWNNAGICYERAGDDKNAVRCLAQAVKLGPTDPFRTRFIYGTALAKLRRSADAIKQFRYITSLEPNSQPAWFNLGLVNDRAGRVDDALAAYGQSRQLAPNHIPTILNTCRLLIEKGQTSDAVDILAGASQAQPKMEVLHAALGAAYMEENKPDQARSEWETGVRLDPTDDLTRARLAQLYLNDSDWAKALAQYDILVKAAPDSDSMLNQRAEAFEQLKQYAPALADLRHALAINPRNAIAWNNLGTVQERLSHNSEALAAYRKAAALSPKMAEARTNIGRLTGHPTPLSIPPGIVVRPSTLPSTLAPTPPAASAPAVPVAPPAVTPPTSHAPATSPAAAPQGQTSSAMPPVAAPAASGGANQSSGTPPAALQAGSGSGTINP